jgi:pimeloyl-ACP methyl ester carboxylesterase
MMQRGNMRILKRILFVFLVLLLLAVAGFTIWAYTPLGPMPEAVAAMNSDAEVAVTTAPWLVFTPSVAEPETGLIIYPGGRVDYRAYAPAAHMIAAQGYLVVIVPMPFNLAVFGPDRADAVIAAYPQVRHWAVGGHSLGGAMAAAYAFNRPEAADGLVFWAAYPAGNNSLADRGLSVVSIYATNDGLATGAKIDASRPLLPANTVWIPIEGGNHAQFADYGEQSGDNPAEISPEAQWFKATETMVAFLAGLAE